jgi:hypothetical protein
VEEVTAARMQVTSRTELERALDTCRKQIYSSVKLPLGRSPSINRHSDTIRSSFQASSERPGEDEPETSRLPHLVFLPQSPHSLPSLCPRLEKQSFKNLLPTQEDKRGDSRAAEAHQTAPKFPFLRVFNVNRVEGFIHMIRLSLAEYQIF